MRVFKTILIALLLSTTYQGAATACPLVNSLVDFNCDGKHEISVVGDSIVYGTGDESNGNKGGYVARLEQLFSSSQVNAFGYPGITTNKLIGYYKKLFARDPRGHEITRLGASDIVIIDIGRNDYFNRNSSTLTAATIKRLTILLSVELEKRFGTAPLFVNTVLPLTRREIDLGFIKQVNMVMLRMRGRDFPAYLRFDTLDTALLGTDGLHPTSAGYDVLASIAGRYISTEAQARARRLRKDSDSDGIYDLFEAIKYNTLPRAADSDGDRLTDGEEVFTYRTNPMNADTDSDGTDDGTEVLQGSDPLMSHNPTPASSPTP